MNKTEKLQKRTIKLFSIMEPVEHTLVERGTVSRKGASLGRWLAAGRPEAPRGRRCWWGPGRGRAGAHPRSPAPAPLEHTSTGGPCHRKLEPWKEERPYQHYYIISKLKMKSMCVLIIYYNAV